MIEPTVFSRPLSLEAATNMSDPAALNELAQMENRVAVGQLLNLLPTDEYHAVRLLFGDEPMTVRDAAKELGTSVGDLFRTKDRALARMRGALTA